MSVDIVDKFAGALTVYSGDNDEEIETLAAAAETRVVAIERTKYSTIDVRTTFKQLVHIGDALRVALAAAGNFRCSVPIQKICNKYQSMIHQSALMSQSFVVTCLEGLKKYRFALKAADYSKPDKAIEQLGKCAELAKRMASAADKLTQDAQGLLDLADDALVQAQEEKGDKAEAREKAKAERAAAEEEQAALQATMETLETDLAEAKKKETRAMKEAEKANKRAFITGLLSIGLEPLAQMGAGLIAAENPMAAFAMSTSTPGAPADTESSVPSGGDATSTPAVAAKVEAEKLKKKKVELQGRVDDLTKRIANEAVDAAKEALQEQLKPVEKELTEVTDMFNSAESMVRTLVESMNGAAKSAMDREMAATEFKNKLQDERREVNAKLARELAKLANLDVKEDTLDKAVAALQIVVTTMGRVRTTFQHVHVFWSSVHAHCLTLTDVSKDDYEFLIEVDPVDFRKCVVDQAISWTALGRVDLHAHEAIVKAAANADNLFAKLPTGSESATVVSKLAEDLLDTIQIDDVDCKIILSPGA